MCKGCYVPFAALEVTAYLMSYTSRSLQAEGPSTYRSVDKFIKINNIQKSMTLDDAIRSLFSTETPPLC